MTSDEPAGSQDDEAATAGTDAAKAHRFEGEPLHDQQSDPGEEGTEPFEEPGTSHEQDRGSLEERDRTPTDDATPEGRPDDDLDRRTGEPSGDPAGPDQESLEAWTRAELASHAEDLGLEIHRDDDRTDLIRRIEAEM